MFEWWVWSGQATLGPFPFPKGFGFFYRKECRLHIHGQPVTPAQRGLLGSQTSASAYKLLLSSFMGQELWYSHIKCNPITPCQNASWKDPLLFCNFRAHKWSGDDMMTDTHICRDRSGLIWFFHTLHGLWINNQVCGFGNLIWVFLLACGFFFHWEWFLASWIHQPPDHDFIKNPWIGPFLSSYWYASFPDTPKPIHWQLVAAINPVRSWEEFVDYRQYQQLSNTSEVHGSWTRIIADFYQ